MLESNVNDNNKSLSDVVSFSSFYKKFDTFRKLTELLDKGISFETAKNTDPSLLAMINDPKKYDTLKENTEGLNTFLTSKLKGYKEKNEEYKKQIKELQDKKKSLDLELQKLKIEQEDLTTKNLTLSQELNGTQENNKQIALNDKISILDNRLKTIDGDIGAKNKEKTAIEEQLTAQEKEYSDYVNTGIELKDLGEYEVNDMIKLFDRSKLQMLDDKISITDKNNNKITFSLKDGKIAEPKIDITMGDGSVISINKDLNLNEQQRSALTEYIEQCNEETSLYLLALMTGGGKTFLASILGNTIFTDAKTTEPSLQQFKNSGKNAACLDDNNFKALELLDGNIPKNDITALQKEEEELRDFVEECKTQLEEKVLSEVGLSNLKDDDKTNLIEEIKKIQKQISKTNLNNVSQGLVGSVQNIVESITTFQENLKKAKEAALKVFESDLNAKIETNNKELETEQGKMIKNFEKPNAKLKEVDDKLGETFQEGKEISLRNIVTNLCLGEDATNEKIARFKDIRDKLIKNEHFLKQATLVNGDDGKIEFIKDIISGLIDEKNLELIIKELDTKYHSINIDDFRSAKNFKGRSSWFPKSGEHRDVFWTLKNVVATIAYLTDSELKDKELEDAIENCATFSNITGPEYCFQLPTDYDTSKRVYEYFNVTYNNDAIGTLASKLIEGTGLKIGNGGTHPLSANLVNLDNKLTQMKKDFELKTKYETETTNKKIGEITTLCEGIEKELTSITDKINTCNTKIVNNSNELIKQLNDVAEGEIKNITDQIAKLPKEESMSAEDKTNLASLTGQLQSLEKFVGSIKSEGFAKSITGDQKSQDAIRAMLEAYCSLKGGETVLATVFTTGLLEEFINENKNKDNKDEQIFIDEAHLLHKNVIESIEDYIKNGGKIKFGLLTATPDEKIKALLEAVEGITLRPNEEDLAKQGEIAKTISSDSSNQELGEVVARLLLPFSLVSSRDKVREVSGFEDFNTKDVDFIFKAMEPCYNIEEINMDDLCQNIANCVSNDIDDKGNKISEDVSKMKAISIVSKLKYVGLKRIHNIYNMLNSIKEDEQQNLNTKDADMIKKALLLVGLNCKTTNNILVNKDISDVLREFDYSKPDKRNNELLQQSLHKDWARYVTKFYPEIRDSHMSCVLNTIQKMMLSHNPSWYDNYTPPINCYTIAKNAAEISIEKNAVYAALHEKLPDQKKANDVAIKEIIRIINNYTSGDWEYCIRNDINKINEHFNIDNLDGFIEDIKNEIHKKKQSFLKQPAIQLFQDFDKEIREVVQGYNETQNVAEGDAKNIETELKQKLSDTVSDFVDNKLEGLNLNISKLYNIDNIYSINNIFNDQKIAILTSKESSNKIIEEYKKMFKNALSDLKENLDYGELLEKLYDIDKLKKVEIKYGDLDLTINNNDDSQIAAFDIEKKEDIKSKILQSLNNPTVCNLSCEDFIDSLAREEFNNRLKIILNDIVKEDFITNITEQSMSSIRKKSEEGVDNNENPIETIINSIDKLKFSIDNRNDILFDEKQMNPTKVAIREVVDEYFNKDIETNALEFFDKILPDANNDELSKQNENLNTKYDKLTRLSDLQDDQKESIDQIYKNVKYLNNLFFKLKEKGIVENSNLFTKDFNNILARMEEINNAKNYNIRKQEIENAIDLQGKLQQRIEEIVFAELNNIKESLCDTYNEQYSSDQKEQTIENPLPKILKDRYELGILNKDFVKQLSEEHSSFKTTLETRIEEYKRCSDTQTIGNVKYNPEAMNSCVVKLDKKYSTGYDFLTGNTLNVARMEEKEDEKQFHGRGSRNAPQKEMYNLPHNDPTEEYKKKFQEELSKQSENEKQKKQKQEEKKVAAIKKENTEYVDNKIKTIRTTKQNNINALLNNEDIQDFMDYFTSDKNSDLKVEIKKIRNAGEEEIKKIKDEILNNIAKKQMEDIKRNNEIAKNDSKISTHITNLAPLKNQYNTLSDIKKYIDGFTQRLSEKKIASNASNIIAFKKDYQAYYNKLLSIEKGVGSYKKDITDIFEFTLKDFDTTKPEDREKELQNVKDTIDTIISKFKSAMDGIERNNKNPKNNKIDINYTNITKALTQFSNVLEKEMGSKSKNFDISKIKTQIEKCLNTTFAVVDEKIESLQTGLGTIFKAVTEVNEKSKITPTKTPEAIKRAAEKVSTSLTKSSNNKTPGNSWNKGVSNNTSYLRSNSVSKSPGNSWNKGVSNNTSYLRSNSVSKTISSNNSFSNSPTNKRYNSVGNNIKLSLRDTYKSPSKTTSYNRFNPSKSTTTSSFGGLNNNPVYSKTTNNFLNRIKNNIKKTGQSGVSYNGMSNGKFKFTIKNKSKTGFSSFGSLGNNYKNCKNYAKRSLNITNVYKKGNPPKTR